MLYLVFLIAALLTGCSGDSLDYDPPVKVQAFAGGDVVLPCSFSITANDDLPSVEWSKKGLQPDVVFLYRHGCETYEMKNPVFEFRTSLITRELKNRNFSLRISNLKLSDAGTYRCSRLWRNAPYDITEVELIVDAVSEPKLSFGSAEGGGVTLQCEAICWLPEPEITFLDDEGNHLTADEPEKVQDACGCYTVTRRLSLQGTTKRVTCRVHQPEINQTRTTETLIPADCMRSCSLSTGFAVGGTLSLLLNLCGLALCLRKRFGRSGGYTFPVRRKSSAQSSRSAAYENQSLLQSVMVDGDTHMENSPTDVAPVQSRPSEPGLRRTNSNPDVLKIPLPASSSSTSSPKKRVSFDSRFANTPSAQRGPNLPNLKRRHSSVLPYSLSNHFHLPAEVPEETLTSI
ncbi:butyrophilin subfamily 1 member A1-like [Xyrichtys novacula]|uniref:Butyrophilin subfamily 1 member A1-like n=1 Tax=Xyrichtys novacula TaxID=13765 RepID=A0AAV1HKY1_XYRNO|nr:butyrophilin subfamily 1 member A1-like [Xyrichtys novacula]